MDLIYLDNNATTQPAMEVVAAMDQMQLELWGNPSSVHRFGQQARQQIELARASVAALVGCRDRELVFTSGGTESNNLALLGLLDRPNSDVRPLLITTRVEHSAIRSVAAHLADRGCDVLYLPLNPDGCVNPADLRTLLAEHASTARPAAVSVQWANNETGVLQPMAQLAQVVHEHRSATGVRVFLHTDATQAVGKMPVNVQAIRVDLLTLAAHKFHGPKGVGALYVRTGVPLQPTVRGGAQERQRRGGTENTPGIVGLGVAAQLAAEFLVDQAALDRQRSLRDRFESQLLAQLPGAVVNGQTDPATPRLWNTSNLGFPSLEAEAILLGLSERGLCASAGAACSSGSLEPSPVLLAMGVAEPVAHGSVRFSLSRETSESQIQAAVAIVPDIVRRLSRMLPMSVE